MLRVGILGYVVPLLFGFDTTHDEDGPLQPPFDSTDAPALRGPAFLGLGVERSNMQVDSWSLSGQ